MRFIVLLSVTTILLAAGPTLAGEYEEVVHGTPGLLVHYSGQCDADALTDLGGKKLNASLVAEIERGIASAFPALGKAIRLKKGGHVRLPGLGQHEAVSIELWLRVVAPPGEGIAGIFAADNWQSGFVHLNLRPNGVVELAINGVGGGFPLSEPEALPLQKWTHLVATYDRAAAEQKLYCNGRLLIDVAANPAPAINLVESSVGMWHTGGSTRPLEADVDEIAIYDVALTQAQVRQHYAAGKGISAVPVNFARNVQPLLAKHCIGCHGSEKQEGGLRLDIRDWAHRGGESGEPAIQPYAADESHLIQLITRESAEGRMPAEADALSSTEVSLLKTWIDQGADWPDELAGKIEPADSPSTSHWSFQPVRKAAAPVVDHPFVREGNEIDAFIAEKLIEAGLNPSPEADRRTLIRRLYLDVLGLPPWPEDVQAFVEDASSDAWERLVDRTLASPHYGERWASHWLDVIRYGDTHGFEVNTPRDNAWPFRDYVVKSLNEDKPYHRFIMEQIAGDQLGADAATGFLVAAPAIMPGQVGKDVASIRQARADELHEMIVSVGSGVLGLTVGCARCHNHKFDPISQRDYYQLQAVFSGVQYADRPLRSAVEVQLSDRAPLAQVVYGGAFTSSPPTHRLFRGDPMHRRERVAPDVPAIFGSIGLESTTPEAERRLALARWITDPQHPLTSRVAVNRVWQHHFGQGLVATPSDFGGMGAPPTHPELLDFLASRFVEKGWSLKSLHRLILLSSTYRQSSRPTDAGMSKDADGRLLWRFPPRRLEMEPIRDSILAVSGALDRSMGGPGFMVFKPNSNYVRVYDPKDEWGPAEWRRMIYIHRVRMAQDGVFGALDCPDAGQPAPRRSRSTTALQALNLLNSSFMQQQSQLLAERIQHEAGDDPAAQITRLFAFAFQRPPRDTELVMAKSVREEFGLTAVCRAVLNSNEFLWVP